MLLIFSLLLAGVTAKPYLNWPGQYGVQMGPWFVPRLFTLPTSPVVISLDIDHECVAEGVFVNPEDCGSYFTCNDNGFGLTPAKVHCPGEPGSGVLAFNEETRLCDWAANVEGCSSCLSRSKMALQTSPVVVDPFVDFNCTAEGIFMNPEDCGSYISCKTICEEGIKAFNIGCPATLLFNTELGVCDFAHNVPDCAQRTVMSDNQTTDGSEPQTAAIVAGPDCQLVAGQGILPTGPCPGVEAVIAENPHTFEEDPQNFDCSGKAVGDYADPDLTVCDHYFVCTGDGRTFRYDCAGGTLYSSKTGACEHAADVQCGA